MTTSTPWYRESTMLVVAAVLLASLASGAAMLTLALRGDDELVISEHEYQQLRDELRATGAAGRDDER